MKSLSEFLNNIIKESKDGKYLKLDFSGVDGGADLVRTLKNVATSSVITYSSDSQEDIKLKWDQRKVSGFEEIVDVLTDFLNSISSEEHDDIGEKLDKISEAIDELNDWIDDAAFEENPIEIPNETSRKDPEETEKKDE